jgi:hypothetical protein
MSARTWTAVYDPAAGNDLLSVGETTQAERDALALRGLGVALLAGEPDFGTHHWDAPTCSLVANAAPRIRVITVGALRQRLTQAERIAFEMLTVEASINGAIARDLKAEVYSRPYVDLDDPRAAGGLQALYQPLGVLASPARVTELLADGTLAEAYVP